MEPLMHERPRAVDTLESLRRRWLTVAATGILFALAAGVYVLVAGQSYSAHATVLIRPITGNAYSSDTSLSSQSASVALQTEAQLVTSAAVTTHVHSNQADHCTGVTVSATVLLNTQ